MAKLVVSLFVSADGAAEVDPDWHFPYFDDNMGRAVTEDYDISDVLLNRRLAPSAAVLLAQLRADPG
jgi:hypothetical protein